MRCYSASQHGRQRQSPQNTTKPPSQVHSETAQLRQLTLCLLLSLLDIHSNPNQVVSIAVKNGGCGLRQSCVGITDLSFPGLVSQATMGIEK